MSTTKLFYPIFLFAQFLIIIPLSGQEFIELVDSNTNENIKFARVNYFSDGSIMNSKNCDGVIYIQQGKNFYKRIFYGSVNVKWFGAKGDGNINDIGTSDSHAIRRAIEVLTKIYKFQKMSGGNIYGGFTLYFPNGIYIVNETFILPDGINIEGESYVNTIIHTQEPRYIFTNIKGMGHNSIDVLMSTDISIRDITLKQGGIELQGAYNSLIQNVRIMNLFGDDRSATGISIKLSVNLHIRDVKIFGSTGVGIKFEDNAGTGPSTTTTLENIWVSHCKNGILIDGNIGGNHGILTSRIFNSIFEYNDIGIVIKGSIDNFVIRDVHLEQNKTAIDIKGNANMIIENIWGDKGFLKIRNSNNQNKSTKIYLKNVNLPQSIETSFKGKIINN